MVRRDAEPHGVLARGVLACGVLPHGEGAIYCPIACVLACGVLPHGEGEIYCPMPSSHFACRGSLQQSLGLVAQ